MGLEKKQSRKIKELDIGYWKKKLKTTRTKIKQLNQLMKMGDKAKVNQKKWLRAAVSASRAIAKAVRAKKAQYKKLQKAKYAKVNAMRAKKIWKDLAIKARKAANKAAGSFRQIRNN